MLVRSVFAAAALLATSAAASATVPAAKVTYTIAFTGYCDGMTLNVYKGIYTTGNSTGCTSGVFQGLNTSVNKFSGLVVTGNYNYQGSISFLTFSLELAKHTFHIYTSDGTNYSLVNEGKFTFGTPDATAAKPSTIPSAR